MRRKTATHAVAFLVQGPQSQQLREIVSRPGGKLCSQLAELETEYLSLLQMQQQCLGQSNILSDIMEKMLCWSGCLTSNELRVQKRRLAILLRQQQQFSRQQKTLMYQLAQLRERQQALWRELYHFLLGREKVDEPPLANMHLIDYSAVR